MILRGHVEADLGPATAMWEDPVVVRHIGGRPFTREEVWHRILRYIGHWSMRRFGYWAIHERASDRFIGEIGLADWKRDEVPLDCPEAGWVLIPSVHGCGFASEAMELMLNWADANSISRTCCLIGNSNISSSRLARKFGYVPVDPSNNGDRKVYERDRRSS